MLKKYVIESTIPGIGFKSNAEIGKMSGMTSEALNDLGTKIQWHESFIAEDKMYCIYLAENESILREHARKAGFPVDHVAEVKAVIDPASEAYAVHPELLRDRSTLPSALQYS